MTTASNIVVAFHALPPPASGTMPCSLNLSRSAISSSQFCGSLPPALSRAALLIHTQLVEWIFTGAAIQWPSYLAKSCKAVGMTFSQPSLPAISSRLPSAPCSAQSRISKPSICTAVGALPAVTRARNTVMASVPPPPATGISVQEIPCFSRSFLRTSSAAASPPAVHQCRTSTFCLSCALATGAIPASKAQAAVPIAASFKNLCISTSRRNKTKPLDIRPSRTHARQSIPSFRSGPPRSRPKTGSSCSLPQEDVKTLASTCAQPSSRRFK